jgi:hypothetical protein
MRPDCNNSRCCSGGVLYLLIKTPLKDLFDLGGKSKLTSAELFLKNIDSFRALINSPLSSELSITKIGPRAMIIFVDTIIYQKEEGWGPNDQFLCIP